MQKILLHPQIRRQSCGPRSNLGQVFGLILSVALAAMSSGCARLANGGYQENFTGECFTATELPLPEASPQLATRSFLATAYREGGTYPFELHTEQAPGRFSLAALSPFGNRVLFAEESHPATNDGATPRLTSDKHPLWPTWISPERLLISLKLAFISDAQITRIRPALATAITRSGSQLGAPCLKLSLYALKDSADRAHFVIFDYAQGISLILKEAVQD